MTAALQTTDDGTADAVQDALDSALVFRTPTGTPALSIDDGRTLADPRGRTVAALGAWTECDDDPADVWADLTDYQQQAALCHVRLQQAAAAAAARNPRHRASVPRPVRQVVVVDADHARSALDQLRADGSGSRDTVQRKIGSRTFCCDSRGLTTAFFKQGGYTQWLLPVSMADAVALATGDACVRYITRSRRAMVCHD
jgi:hypothetical protein